MAVGAGLAHGAEGAGVVDAGRSGHTLGETNAAGVERMKRATHEATITLGIAERISSAQGTTGLPQQRPQGTRHATIRRWGAGQAGSAEVIVGARGSDGSGRGAASRARRVSGRRGLAREAGLADREAEERRGDATVPTNRALGACRTNEGRQLAADSIEAALREIRPAGIEGRPVVVARLAEHGPRAADSSSDDAAIAR